MKKFVQRSYYGGLRESVLEQLSAEDRRDYQEGASMLKALGDPQRAMLVDALSCRPLCVYEMQQLVSWSQATLSHHLKTLRENGLVNTRREGKWIYYSLNQEGIAAAKNFVERLTSGSGVCLSDFVTPPEET